MFIMEIYTGISHIKGMLNQRPNSNWTHLYTYDLSNTLHSQQIKWTISLYHIYTVSF